MNLSGTKKIIFERSVELFSQSSFESVTLRDIARVVGIRASSIYNHFSSKQELLETIYEFFRCHFFDTRLSVEQIEEVIRNGSVLDIIHCLKFDFEESIDKLMQQILLIIHQRKYFDEQARKISKEITIDAGISFGEEVFTRAVEIGRFAPFNTKELSLICNYIRHSTYMRWLLDPTPEYYAELLDNETRMYEFFIPAIKDLKQGAE